MANHEDRELMDKIAHVAGKINRYKAKETAALAPAQTQSQPQYQASSHRCTSPRRNLDGDSGPLTLRADSPYQSARGSVRFRGRGNLRGRYPTTAHRHRTLVLNGSGQQTPGGSDSGNTSDQPSTGWVARNDRHLQLINSTVYEKESGQRMQAIEESKRRRLLLQNRREKAQLKDFLYSRAATTKNAGGAAASTPRPATDAANSHEINIEGILFQVAKNGSKLVRLPGQNIAPEATPKMAKVAGVKFFRTKNGNLVRDGVVKAHRRSGVVKKLKEPCTFFSTTGTCQKGPQCRYVHDANKVAACKTFLKSGKCENGEACDLSHDLTPERAPACLHHARGNCANPQCPYTHQDVPATAPVCRAFGLYGYCEKGAACGERHVFECPDFANTGKCNTRGCKLLHRERASVLRNQQQHQGGDGDEDVMGDLSSEGESFASDDVDSDEVEEIFADSDAEDFDIKDQDVITF